MKADLPKPAEGRILSEPQSVEPSIQEQIISEMLAGLNEKPEFPPDLLVQIKKLSDRSQLQKAAEVTKVIKSPAGGPHAAA